jgi:hypothetical protein
VPAASPGDPVYPYLGRGATIVVVTEVRSGARYRCAACARDVTGLAWTQPCLCGETYRARVDADETLYRMPDLPGLPRFDPLKDWRIKFLQLSWNVTCLERQYNSTARLPPDAVRTTVALALTCCVDLADWLTAGPEPHTVTARDLDRLLRSDPLRVAADFCGRSGCTGSVRLVPVAFAATSRFWIEHSVTGAKPMRYDALDLVRRCRETWRQYLRGHGVVLPRWDGD